MRILHTADLHLAPRLEYIEDPARRAQRRDDFATFADRLPDLASEHDVDAVVMAGDVFDRDLPSLPEVARLGTALARVGRPVLIVTGTHDPGRSGGCWDRPWPANVHVFTTGEWTTLRVGDTAFHCLGSTGRPRSDGRPTFAGLLPDPAARFQVAVAHASLLWPGVSEKVDRKNYPFEEVELDATGMHYVALGDHHRMRIVRRPSVTAAYPGSPEGLCLDRAEAGDRHALVVELADPATPATVTPVRVNRREVWLGELNAEDLDDLDRPGTTLEAEIRRALVEWARPDRIARIDLVGVTRDPVAVDPVALAEELATGWFHVQLRDRTRVMPPTPSQLPTIRAAFQRRLATRLEGVPDGPQRDVLQRAMALGTQALEGLL